jgi:cytochrome d ubiquinol oxidase subunit II
MVEVWFAIFWAMVTTYVILDGRTLGAGALRLFISSTPDERRQVLDAIGPMWSWYEVWFVGAGGVLPLAFPVLAVAFSGYYLALFLILWLLS